LRNRYPHFEHHPSQRKDLSGVDHRDTALEQPSTILEVDRDGLI
jgi:hypothetical protein